MEVEMLVLSRKEMERNPLGDSIVVTVVRVSGDKVRLGLRRPRTWSCSATNFSHTLPRSRLGRGLTQIARRCRVRDDRNPSVKRRKSCYIDPNACLWGELARQGKRRHASPAAHRGGRPDHRPGTFIRLARNASRGALDRGRPVFFVSARFRRAHREAARAVRLD